jgi:hypothetical protein
MIGPHLVVVGEVNFILKYYGFSTLTNSPTLGNPVVAVPHQVVGGHILDWDGAAVCDNRGAGRDAEHVDEEQKILRTTVENAGPILQIGQAALGNLNPLLKMLYRVFLDEAVERQRLDERVRSSICVANRLANGPALQGIGLLFEAAFCGNCSMAAGFGDKFAQIGDDVR